MLYNSNEMLHYLRLFMLQILYNKSSVILIIFNFVGYLEQLSLSKN